MAECRWLRPELVAQIEFVEWTEANHLRHARFVGLREDNNPKTCTAKSICLRLDRQVWRAKKIMITAIMIIVAVRSPIIAAPFNRNPLLHLSPSRF
jgi:hypothetical protein